MIGSEKKQVLGRGLGALIPAAAAGRVNIHAAEQPQPGEVVREIPVGEIEPNPFQTRINVDPKGIEELAESIKVQGVLQPIVLRQMPGGKLQLVAGQRRLLASQKAGKATVPAMVRQLSDEQAIELTIIENLQREDLNPLDQAAAFEKLSSTCGLTQEVIAARTGKDRTTVANYMRLLKLPSQVQTEIRGGALSMGHARALMALDHAADQILLGQRIVERGMSVRQSEQAVAEWYTPKTRKKKKEPAPRDPNVKQAEFTLIACSGCNVIIEDKNGRGKVTFHYANLDEFEQLLSYFDPETMERRQTKVREEQERLRNKRRAEEGTI